MSGKKAGSVMADADIQVERFLQALVDELAIPESRYEQAETSYKSLGDWFHPTFSK